MGNLGSVSEIISTTRLGLGTTPKVTQKAMETEDLFRLVLILGFVCVLPVAMYHRMKARASRESLDRRQEGLFILLTLRPVGLLRMMGLVAWVIDPTWMDWSSVGLPNWLRWIGVGFGLIAATLLVVTLRNLGTNLTDTVVTRARHTLVTSGPYRWVRHPFYVAFALAVTADSLVTANGFLALTGLTTIGLIVLRTSTEEQKLVDRFGDEYRDYMHRTGRFFPRLRG